MKTVDTKNVIELKKLLKQHEGWSHLLRDSIKEAKAEAIRKEAEASRTAAEVKEGIPGELEGG